MISNKLALSTAALTLCLVASQTVSTPTASASVVRGALMSGHMSMGNKMVKLNVMNSSKATLKIMVGTQAMTIEPGKTVEVKALDGTNVTAVEDTQDHKAGEVLAQITKDLGGATIRIS